MPSAAPPVSARLAFQESCAGCHGAEGTGNGPADPTRIAARNGGALPRDRVMSAIDGYRRRSRFSAAMPALGEGDLGRAAIVENPGGTATPVPGRLLALTDHLESIRAP